MSNLEHQTSKLHRSRLRLLPYAAFGAFIFSLNSASNLSDISKNYLIIVAIELAIIIIYLLAGKFAQINGANNKP